MMRGFRRVCGLTLAAALLAVGAMHAPAAHADDDTKARLAHIKQERAKLQALRRRMEARLGKLGRELNRLDRALVEARGRFRKADAAVRETDAKLADLRDRQQRLAARAERLRRAMEDEAAAAWRHASDQPLWMEALFGGAIAELPHRQYLLSRLVAAQAWHRRQYARAMEELAKVEQALAQEREELAKRRAVRKAEQQALAARLRDKRALWRKIRRDVRLQRQRDAELARQEKALARLLAEVAASNLRAADARVHQVPVRKLRGRLPWPLKGRIVAHFHSRPAPGRPRLAGVQLAPRPGHRQVRAIAPGQVRYADWFGGFGLMMIVDHGDGLVTVYAHNDALYRQVGDWVEAGDVLADAGSTGWVENVRLYFEVRDRGRPVNPARWCRK